jgi:hypothetical protein
MQQRITGHRTELTLANNTKSLTLTTKDYTPCESVLHTLIFPLAILLGWVMLHRNGRILISSEICMSRSRRILIL